jgi:hypothetical protein
MEIADVYKKDRLAGHLRRSRDGVAFTYEDAYLHEGGRAIATTIPCVLASSESRTRVRWTIVQPFATNGSRSPWCIGGFSQLSTGGSANRWKLWRCR